jgi:hypothetical protein
MELAKAMAIGRAAMCQIESYYQNETQQEKKSPDRTGPSCRDGQQECGYGELPEWQHYATLPGKPLGHTKGYERLT